ncbi:hypothetical protein NE237_001208 [Protea cynaroides]|uniref:Uncharacterized protein n=1 Tax=Protea cynaroides TaxID=273540 RepID=A0A9Q0KSP1_9MAGN|nr:hypothetical protein NE237_001208 [Protea cynaroides]
MRESTHSEVQSKRHRLAKDDREREMSLETNLYKSFKLGEKVESWKNNIGFVHNQILKIHSWVRISKRSSPFCILVPALFSQDRSCLVLLSAGRLQLKRFTEETALCYSSSLFIKMARDTRALEPWMEIAPALYISAQKSSNSPRLETIREEDVPDQFQT